jgi:hypothetical protein
MFSPHPAYSKPLLSCMPMRLNVRITAAIVAPIAVSSIALSAEVAPMLNLPQIPALRTDDTWRARFGAPCDERHPVVYEELRKPFPLPESFAIADGSNTAKKLADAVNLTLKSKDSVVRKLKYLAQDLSEPIPRLMCLDVPFEDGPQSASLCEPPIDKYGPPTKRGGKWVLPVQHCAGRKIWVESDLINEKRQAAGKELLDLVSELLRQQDGVSEVQWGEGLARSGDARGRILLQALPSTQLSVEIICGAEECRMVLREDR